MLASNWQPTAHLRYAAVSGQMQQLWKRECSETREYNGRPRLCTWTEQQWRDIPTEQPAPETPAAPRGKPCTCSDTTASACGVEQGGKLGELWHCRRAILCAQSTQNRGESP